MGIVSYAQNFEDVILWRALKDIKNGFYVDVGANEPEHFSVTKLFYDNGWHGINIEPVPEVYKMLEEERNNDLNLNIAISAQKKEINLFISNLNDKGLSTTNVNVVEESQYQDSFNEKIVIKAKSLNEVFKDNNVKEVHFLKIDVEGAERDVLESFSFDIVRPWICVVEATKPTTQIDISYEWESILLNHGYIFAYFDGLNKFYVSKEQENLVNILKTPPNIFDEFILSSHKNALLMNVEAEKRASEAEKRASEAERRASEAERRANDTLHNYHLILSSNSWKCTKSLRLFGKFSRWFYYGIFHWITFSPTSRPRRILRKKLSVLKQYINSNPKLKNILIRFLNNFPTLKDKLKKVRNDYEPLSNHLKLSDLTPNAKDIYLKIKNHIEQ